MKQAFNNILLYLFFSLSSFTVLGQNVEKIKLPELEKILNNPEDKLFVVNFWATWCAPCVKELPHFETVSKDYNSKNIRFLLVSLDFPSQIDKQLIPFLKKNSITLSVSVMMESDYNSWIDKVDPAWQGDIPATLIFNNFKKQRIFHTGELDEPGLRKMISSFL
jgi:thiol-disulfide isomerase/thioredoxin